MWTEDSLAQSKAHLSERTEGSDKRLVDNRRGDVLTALEEEKKTEAATGGPFMDLSQTNNPTIW